MSRFRFVLPSMLATGIAGAARGQIGKPDTAPARTVLPKNERAGVWQPTQGGVQMPLWPANTPLAKPALEKAGLSRRVYQLPFDERMIIEPHHVIESAIKSITQSKSEIGLRASRSRLGHGCEPTAMHRLHT